MGVFFMKNEKKKSTAGECSLIASKMAISSCKIEVHGVTLIYSKLQRVINKCH